MSTSQNSAKTPWIWLSGLGALVLVGVVGAVIYLSPKDNNDAEAAMACVANAFPVVVMEHGKLAIDRLLRELQAESEEAVEEGEEEELFPEQWVLSKDIDERFLDLAQLIQSEEVSEEEALELQLHINSEIQQLVALFQSQASDYLQECTQLFHEMTADCEDLSGDSLESQGCMEKYQDRVAQLMAKHLDYRPESPGL